MKRPHQKQRLDGYGIERLVEETLASYVVEQHEEGFQEYSHKYCVRRRYSSLLHVTCETLEAVVGKLAETEC